MKALILAAGEGSRLRPLTLDRPKPMVDLAGMPVLEHILLWLREGGVRDIAINLHYKPDVITDYFGDGSDWGVEITYSFEQELLGSAGALRQLDWYFDGPVAVVYGDVVTTMPFARIARVFQEARFRQLEPCAVMALYHVANPTECGIVELDRERRVSRIVEKPKAHEVFSTLANAGVMLLDRPLLNYVPDVTPCDIARDLLPALLFEGLPVYGVELLANETLIDIGTMENYRRACREWSLIEQAV